MSRRASILLPAALCFACGDATQTTVTQSGGDPTTNVTADPSSTGSTGSTDPTTSTTSTTTTPTTAGEGSATDSGTSTGGTSTTTFTTGSSDDTGTSSPAQTDTGPQGTSSTGPDDTGTGDTGDSSTGDVVACACPDIEVALDDGIFLLSASAELWKYFPETNKFEMLGQIDCAGQFATFSMAVDRLGFAWVMFNNPQGEIWKVDVTNVAKCTDPGYNQGQMGVNYFGMAFVSNSEADQCDALYGNTFNGIGGFGEGPNIGDFLTVNPDTLILSKLGKTKFNGAELTGTGDGRTFMFGGVNPSKLVEVDKANGQFIDEIPLPNLPLTNAFAFSFFAGDFYMFTESANPNVSKVTQFDYDDSDMNGKQDLTTVVAAAPIRIVGAGVSTCAPFAPQ